jgi:hypothetical protein
MVDLLLLGTCGEGTLAAGIVRPLSGSVSGVVTVLSFHAGHICDAQCLGPVQRKRSINTSVRCGG